MGLTASFTAPGASAATVAFNGARLPSVTTLQDGRTLTSTYDSGGRLTGTTAADGDTALTYVAGTSDPATLQSTPASGTGETLSDTYDGDALTGVTFAGLASGAYSYDYEFGELDGVSLDAGAAGSSNETLSYDGDNLLTGDGNFAFTRDGTGLVTDIGDGTFDQQFSYDDLGNEKNRATTVDSTPVGSDSVSRDDTGRITQQVITVGTTTTTYAYTYDADGRLTAVSKNGAASESYAYDADGDLTSRQSGGTAAQPFTYDGEDRETALGGVTYVYDADGQLAKRGSDTFDYGVRSGELLSATVGTATVTYGYDALGRRVSRTTGGATEQFLYGDPNDPQRLTASIAGGTLTTYEYDAAGRLIGLDRGGTQYYVVTDEDGSPLAVVDATGTIVKTITYDAYGEVLSDSAPSFDLPIGFDGGLSDPLTDLVHFGARDYDPASGRFTERDPTLYDGGPNLYAFASDDPVDNVDPTGLDDIGSGSTSGDAASSSSASSSTDADSPNFSPLAQDWSQLVSAFDKYVLYPAADKVGDLEQAINSFCSGTGPKSAVPLLKQFLSWADGQGPISLTPDQAVQQTIDNGVQNATAASQFGSEASQLSQVDN